MPLRTAHSGRNVSGVCSGPDQPSLRLWSGVFTVRVSVVCVCVCVCVFTVGLRCVCVCVCVCVCAQHRCMGIGKLWLIMILRAFRLSHSQLSIKNTFYCSC